MSDTRLSLDAVRMRQQFDASFAVAPQPSTRNEQHLVVVTVGEGSVAVKLDEISSLHTQRTIVPVPSADPTFLGLIGLRNTPVPVFDLRTLLGRQCTAVLRGFAVLRSAEPVALAFDAFETHLQLPASALNMDQSAGTTSPFLSGVVSTKERLIPLLHCASLIEALTLGGDASTPTKEK